MEDRPVEKDDLISRAAAIEAAFKDADEWDGGFNPKHLRAVPAVDAVPVVYGRWEVCGDCGITRCSACKWNFEGHIDYKYCPNCGAKNTES